MDAGTVGLKLNKGFEGWEAGSSVCFGLANSDGAADLFVDSSAPVGVGATVDEVMPAKGFAGFSAFDGAGCVAGVPKFVNGEAGFGASALVAGAAGAPKENEGLAGASVAGFENDESKMLFVSGCGDGCSSFFAVSVLPAGSG